MPHGGSSSHALGWVTVAEASRPSACPFGLALRRRVSLGRARQDEERVGEAIQPRQQVLAVEVAVVDAFDDFPLSPPDDGPGMVERRGNAVLAGHDETTGD